MSHWSCISASLCEEPGTFGEFQACHTLCIAIKNNQLGKTSLSGSGHQPGPDKRTLLSEPDVSEYLDRLKNLENQPDICILAFESRRPASNGLLPLPISRSLFENVAQEFKISSDYLTVLSTGVATFLSPLIRSGCADWEHARLVLQQNTSYSCNSMALSFNTKTGKTRVLIFGAQSWSLSEMFSYLSSTSQLPFGPIFVPTIAMELQAKWFTGTINACHGKIYDIESITGMRRLLDSSHDNPGIIQDWKKLDLIDIARELNSILSRLAFFKLQVETSTYLVEKLEQSVKAIKEALEKDGENFQNEAQDRILSKLEHVQSWFFGIKARCVYLGERAQAQVQTVYNLIASQDSLANVEIAQASRDIAKESKADSEAMRMIAELSRRDNQLMIQIAKDSRAVAIATARDSATMRVIAGVTILFLPATFAATFFSMTFFNFLNGDKPQVSPLMWIYVLVTILLTIIIQTIWAVISRQKENQVAQTIVSD